MGDKPFAEMTLEELRTERAEWQQKIEGATGWGASLAAAAQFVRGCDQWIARRERALEKDHDT